MTWAVEAGGALCAVVSIVPARGRSGSRPGAALPRWSRPAAALPQEVWDRRCAAAGGLVVLVRCRGRRWGWAPKGASTGRLASALVRGLGLRVGAGVDARFCVRALEGQGSAFLAGSRRERRSVRPRTRGWSIVGALCVGVTRDSPFSWTVPRKGRIPTPLRPRSVDQQPQKRSCGCRSTDRTLQRRTVAPERRNEESCVIHESNPDHETPSLPQARCRSRPFGAHPQRRPRQRTSKVRTTAGNAAAGRRPLRQRTSTITPPHHPTQAHPRAHREAPQPPPA